MKTFFYCLISGVLFLSTGSSYAQSSGLNYLYTQPANTMIFNSSAAGAVTLIPGGADDQVITFTIPSTWSGFYFGGKWFTQNSLLYVSSNGWMSFSDPGGNAIPQNSLWTLPLTIAPLWDDLKIHADGLVSYQVSGGIGARCLVVEWRGMKWDRNATDSALSFQAIIYDNAQTISSMRNVIEFRYKRNGTDISYINNNSGGASIGISGSCGDVFAFTNSTGAPDNTSPENSAIALKPPDVVSHRFTPQTHPNDECANAEVLVFNPALPVISVDASTLHSTQSAGNLPSCGTPTTTNDVWFTFTKPVGITSFEIYTDSLDCRGISYANGIELFSSCGGASIACDFGSNGPGNTNATSYLSLVNQGCAAQQYWVRAYSTDSAFRGYFRFNIRPPGRNCAFANDFTSCGLPYSSPVGLSACGYGNDFDSMMSSPHTHYMHGEDYIFKFTPTVDECVDISLSNTPQNSNPGLFIYSGCPDFGDCIGYVTGSGGTPISFTSLALSSGIDYYFLVDNDSAGNVCVASFDFAISISSGSLATNDVCAAAINIPVTAAASCIGAIDYTHNCATASAQGAYPIPGCGFFVDGISPDVWFTFTSTGNTVHRIQVDPGTAPAADDLDMAVYTGNCASLTLLTCDDYSNGLMPLLTLVPDSAGITYYVRVWSNNGTQSGNFKICVTDGCSCPNDFCSTAIPLTIGQYAPGDNSCATGVNEPGGVVTCWTGQSANELNTVWYTFVATDDTMKIRTHLLTLYDSQIALYQSSGGCNGTFAQIYCNNDALGYCSVYSPHYSQITAAGLLVGSTYYIRVDGVHANTGTFEIIVLPLGDPYPPMHGQDCSEPISVCANSTITVASPGYHNSGNYCDIIPGATCLNSGEVNSVYYTFSVTGTGAGTPVEFTISPARFANYDFMLWCIKTDTIPAISNYCDSLSNGYAFPSSVCNFSLQGITGCSAAVGTCPFPCYQSYGYSDPGIMPAVVVPNGMTATFLLLVNSNTYHEGFTLDWMGTPIDCPQLMAWQGGASTDWTNILNWTGNVVVPSCTNGVGAVISAGTYQPVISSNTDVSDITINQGATLTINPGITLSVCGNFVNNGQLNFGAGSTIKFIGNRNTSIAGSNNFSQCMFPNIEIAKDSGATVSLYSHLYVMGNDSIYGGIFNTNGNDMDLGGNFYNYDGNNSFVSSPGTDMVFNYLSSTPQHFRNDGSFLALPPVYMNQSINGSVILDTNTTSDMNVQTLFLSAGKIITGPQRKVNVLVDHITACNAGNSTSYVEGNLQRAIAAVVGNYEFPVGDPVRGYQRFTLELTSLPDSGYTIEAKFRQWNGGVPAGPALSECFNSGWDIFPAFDQGYWTLDASMALGVGTYSAHVYPTNVLNNVGLTFSIMKAASNNGQGPWAMEGSPFCASTASHVQRDGLTSFSDFAIVQSDIGNSISDPETEEPFISVAPNPASGKTTIYFEEVEDPLIINLTDLTGRIILSTGTIDPHGKELIEIKLEGIVPGIYLLHAKSEDHSAIVKLIINGN